MNRTFSTIHVMQNVFDIQSSRMIATSWVCLSISEEEDKCNELDKHERIAAKRIIQTRTLSGLN